MSVAKGEKRLSAAICANGQFKLLDDWRFLDKRGNDLPFVQLGRDMWRSGRWRAEASFVTVQQSARRRIVPWRRRAHTIL